MEQTGSVDCGVPGLESVKFGKIADDKVGIVRNECVKRREVLLKDFTGYWASEDGRIWRKKADVFREVRMFHSNFKDKKLRVHLRNVKGKDKCLYVHFLVLVAWKGYRGKAFWARHKSADLLDNKPCNLYWGVRPGASFWDILGGDDELTGLWLAKMSSISDVYEARKWNEKVLRKLSVGNRTRMMQDEGKWREWLKELFKSGD